MQKNLQTMNKKPQLDFYDLGRGAVAFSSTRQGGWSKGSYAGFNINEFCGDDEGDVLRNRQALCRLLGIGEDRLLMPHQVHQSKIIHIDEELLRKTRDERRQLLDGYDALMTDVAGVCIGVSTADCIPVLLFDAEHHAVCAVHAGWRGTVARIAEKAVAAMRETYGTRPSQLKAQIGPGIGLDSFEVGDEVYAAFAESGFDMGAISRREEKWHIDLPECNRMQLAGAGIPAGAIGLSRVCTFQHPERYFSARRLGVRSGRIFSGIMLTA